MYLYSFVLAIFSVRASIRYVSLCRDIAEVSGVDFCRICYQK